MVLFGCQSHLSEKYTVTGDIKGLKTPWLYLEYSVGDSSRMDSVSVKDGHFVFTGQVAQPVMAYLSTKEQYVPFFLENADIRLKGSIDSLDSVKITGSVSQTSYDSLNASMKGVNDQMNAVYQEYDQATKQKDTTRELALETRIDSIRELRRADIETFVVSHPASPVSLYQITGMTYSMDYPVLERMFLGLDTGLQNSPVGVSLAKKLALIKRREVGEKAMDFTQTDMLGQPVQFSQYSKGKYVLLDFWASWCGPCRAENPNVLKAYNRFKGKNFDVLGVSLDSDSSRWKQAVAKDGMPWMQVADLKGWKNEVARQYGIEAIPFNFLVDTNGVIIAKDLRGGALEKKLATVLK